MQEKLLVNEIYLSIQGESTFAGLPCVFIRTTGCDLRCSYCDTAYAFGKGTRQTLEEIRHRVDQLAGPFGASGAAQGQARLPLVELTGGEPLLQRPVIPLMQRLCDDGYTVLLETSGAHDISPVDSRVRRVVDLKCPSSGESARNRWENIAHLKATDEVKFVIATVEDFQWARAQLETHSLTALCPVLFSWASPLLPSQRDSSLCAVPDDQTPISRRELVERIIAEALPVRFQVQMHKVIWAADAKGV